MRQKDYQDHPGGRWPQREVRSDRSEKSLWGRAEIRVN